MEKWITGATQGPARPQAFRDPQGNTKYPQASPQGALSLAAGGREAVTALSVATKKVPMSVEVSYHWVTAGQADGDWDGVGDVHGRAGAQGGYYQSGHQLRETIA